MRLLLPILFAAPSLLLAQHPPTRAALLDSVAREQRFLKTHPTANAAIRLSLSRQLFRLGREREGSTQFFAAAADTSATGAPLVFAENLLGMPGLIWGKIHWDSLTPAGRFDEVQALWTDCDVDSGLGKGTCLREINKRLAWVDDHFRSRDSANTRTWDDRGRVWAKRGAPAVRITAHDGPTPYEIWRYNLSFGAAVIYLRGNAASDSRQDFALIPSLEDAPLLVRKAACKADPDSCDGPRHDTPVAGRFSPVLDSAGKVLPIGGNGKPSPVAVARGASVNKYMLDVRAIANRFRKPIQVAAQPIIYADPTTFKQRFATTLLIPARQVPASHRARVQMVAAPSGGGPWRTVDTTIILDRRYPADTMLGGVVDFEIPPRAWGNTLIITLANGRGAMLSPSGDPQSGLKITSMFGGGASERVLRRPTVPISFSPERVFGVGDTIHVFFQVAPIPRLKTLTVSLRFGPGEQANRATRISETMIPEVSMEPGLREYRYDFPLKDLPPGRYNLALTFIWDFLDSKAQASYQPTAAFTLKVKQ